MSIFVYNLKGASFEYINDYDKAIKWHTKAISTPTMLGPGGALDSYISVNYQYTLLPRHLEYYYLLNLYIHES